MWLCFNIVFKFKVIRSLHCTRQTQKNHPFISSENEATFWVKFNSEKKSNSYR